MCGKPSGTPSALTAKVVGLCRPSVPADPLVFAITPRPLQAWCVETFRSLPSWIAKTVDCARMRHGVRARCGARIAFSVRAGSSGQSIIRQDPCTTAASPQAAVKTVFIGVVAWIRVLATGLASAALPTGAPPNSVCAQRSLSSPAPAARPVGAAATWPARPAPGVAASRAPADTSGSPSPALAPPRRSAARARLSCRHESGSSPAS